MKFGREPVPPHLPAPCHEKSILWAPPSSIPDPAAGRIAPALARPCLWGIGASAPEHGESAENVTAVSGPWDIRPRSQRGTESARFNAGLHRKHRAKTAPCSQCHRSRHPAAGAPTRTARVRGSADGTLATQPGTAHEAILAPCIPGMPPTTHPVRINPDSYAPAGVGLAAVAEAGVGEGLLQRALPRLVGQGPKQRA